jgi:hypothetical protein
MRQQVFLFFLAVACLNTPKQNSETSSNTEDVAHFTAHVHVLGEEVQTDVNIHTNDSVETYTAGVENDVSTGTFDITLGSLNKTTLDGLPLHVEHGFDWVHPIVSESFSKDEDRTEVYEMNRYFALNLQCTDLACEYDSSAEDGFGDLCNPAYNWGVQFVEVVNGHELHFDGDAFNSVGSNGSLTVSGDSLSFNGVDNMRLERSSIGDDHSLTFAFVQDEDEIIEFNCVPE